MARYLADYDPLLEDELYGTGTYAEPPVPSSIQALAQDPASVSEEALAQPLAPQTPVVRPIAAPASPEIRGVRDPVDLMVGARQEAQAARQRGNLAGLVDALITGGANRQMLAQQAQQQAQEALQAGQLAQRREDLAVGQAREEQQAQLKARAAGAGAAAKAALADPNSPQALALQASLRASPMGQHLGEATIRRITPANLKQYSQVLSEAQKGAALTREDTRFNMEKERRLSEAEERQKRLLPGELKKRRAGATIVGLSRIDLARQMEELKAQKRLEAKKEERTYRRGEDIRKQARSYATDLNKTGLASIDKNIKDLEKAIIEATDGRELFSKFDFGKFKLGSVGTSAISDPKSKRVAVLYWELLNKKIKEQAGSAVSGNEFERVKLAAGTGLFATQDDLMDSVRRFRSAADNAFIDAAAPYDKEALDLYQERFKGAKEKGAGGRVAPSYKVPAGKVLVQKGDGKPVLLPIENLEKAKARGYTEVQQ